MPQYRIGEVARRSKLKASAIRYYEDEGLIPAPARKNGRRVFTEEVFDHLTLITTCQAAGFSLLEIRELKAQLQRAPSPGPQWRAVASRKAVQLDQAIARLHDMKSVLGLLEHCRCPTLTDCARAARSTSRPPPALARS